MKNTFKKKKKEVADPTIYVTNPTDKDIKLGELVCEPGDAVSIPVELEKEAREKGLV